jgi:hypothetical protein
MDFIVGLPNTSLRHDSIGVIVDRLTKTAHFLPMHTTYNAKKYAEIYLDQIVRLHEVCQTLLSWSQTGERKIFGPDLVMEAEDKVKVIQTNLKAAQSRQKSYADIRRPYSFKSETSYILKYLLVEVFKGSA